MRLREGGAPRPESKPRHITPQLRLLVVSSSASARSIKKISKERHVTRHPSSSTDYSDRQYMGEPTVKNQLRTSASTIEKKFADTAFRLNQERNDFLLPQSLDFVGNKKWLNLRPEYQRRRRFGTIGSEVSLSNRFCLMFRSPRYFSMSGT